MVLFEIQAIKEGAITAALFNYTPFEAKIFICRANTLNFGNISSATMYIIKVKGKAKIPNYIQIRDENFVLVAYFRADRPMKNVEKFGLEGKEEELETLIKDLPFGKLQKLEL